MFLALRVLSFMRPRTGTGEPHARLLRLPRRRFTLIELMIVVVIIAIISAVAIPALLKASQRAKGGKTSTENSGGEKRVALEQRPMTATVEGAAERQTPARPPELLSTEIDATLLADYLLDGLSVQTHYRADFRGRFVLRNRDSESETLSLHFPFPPGITEARKVGLTIILPSGEKLTASDPSVSYGATGISWKGKVAEGQRVTAEVRYEADGREVFRYAVGSAGRSEKVRVSLTLPNVANPRIPPPSEALQATSREPFEGEAGSGVKLRWELDEAITRLPIIVELPATESPFGRLILLGRLAALAVLIFGAGFLYLSQGHAPGQLDDFGWSHFLLLAFSYFIFFPVFAVSELFLGFRIAAGLGLLASIPLLMVHVTRFTSLKFALGRALPLALWTLAVVVAAVYLPTFRVPVYTGAGVMVVAFLTVDLEGWLDVQDEYETSRSAERRLASFLSSIGASLLSAGNFLIEARDRVGTLRKALEGLEDLPEGAENVGRSTEAVAEELVGLDAEATTLKDRLAVLREASIDSDFATEGSSAERASERLFGRLGELIEELKRNGQVLDRALIGVRQRVELALSELRQSADQASRLAADLKDHGEDLERRLGLEGTPPEAVAIGVAARAIQGEVAHLVGERSKFIGGLKALEGVSQRSTFKRESASLRRSGERLLVRSRRSLAELQELARRMDKALAAERRRLELAARQDQEASGTLGHCSACGGRVGLEHTYCGNCAAPLPVKQRCGACAFETLLPIHLVKRSLRAHPKLRCPRCGERMGRCDGERVEPGVHTEPEGRAEPEERAGPEEPAEPAARAEPEESAEPAARAEFEEGAELEEEGTTG